MIEPRAWEIEDLNGRMVRLADLIDINRVVAKKTPLYTAADFLAALREPSEAMVRAAYADQPDAINAGFSQAFRAMLDQFERDQGSAT